MMTSIKSEVLCKVNLRDLQGIAKILIGFSVPFARSRIGPEYLQT